jgi:hypothetical protein
MAEFLTQLAFYFPGQFGVLSGGIYMFLFFLTINPAIFKIFRPHHYWIFAAGAVLSLLNHRAILPALLLIIIDADYSKITPELLKTMSHFFLLGLFIMAIFSGRPL